MAHSAYIIYQNPTNTVFLMDLPTSIQNGQSSCRRIRSSEPPFSPYPSAEPKVHKLEKVRASVPLHMQQLHRHWEQLIEAALSEIKGFNHAHSLTWCHERGHEEQPCISRAVGDGIGNLHITKHLAPRIPVILSTTEEVTHFPLFGALQRTTVHNPNKNGTSVIEVGGTRYFIPPRSTFILASIRDALPILQDGVSTFQFSMSHISRTGFFDLILMDPPWANRSVRRASAYITEEVQPDVFQQALSIARKYLADSGTIAVWITNKAAIRAQAIHQLQSLGFQLYEEWIWSKVTVKGEPTTQLHGLWRKPYEILMLFRQIDIVEEVLHRVIIAVPDLHSRKPCLKGLFDKLQPPEYKALELFARSLTAGWWSLGDEALKFQHEGHWSAI